MRALLAVALLVPASGCFGEGLGCDEERGRGGPFAVRVVWNDTRLPVEGACVHAYTTSGAGKETRVGTRGDGTATLLLEAGEWRVFASKVRDDDRYCAYQSEPRTVDMPGAAPLTLAVSREIQLCA